MGRHTSIPGEADINQMTLSFDEILLAMGVKTRKQFPASVRWELPGIHTITAVQYSLVLKTNLIQMQPRYKPLTVFRLVMMTVVAIDSLKNLPVNAQYGSSLLFFYLLATLTFFIPSALVAAELASAWPKTGGIYIWVREAFGQRAALLVVWIQWLFMVIWYPTILSFIAVTLAYWINPEWAHNKFYVLATILIIFWLATGFSCMGLKISSSISSVTAILGTLIPMFFIILLGVFWLYSGKESHLNLSSHALTLNLFTTENARLFITLLFSLMGMDMIAVHAGDVNNPQRDYPRALMMAGVIILATVIPASLAIAIVIPGQEISLTSGVIEGFRIFLTAFSLQWMEPLVITAIIIGCFGIFFTWLLAAARCLLIAAYDKSLPHFLIKTNQKNMPVGVLLIQGIIFSVLSSAFVMMPSIDSAFWFLTAASSQLALIYYLFLFAAALQLRYKKPDIHRPFRVGKHPLVLWVVCIVPMLTCIMAIIFGFLPPPEITREQIISYEFFLCLLMVASCVIGLIIYQVSQNSHKL